MRTRISVQLSLRTKKDVGMGPGAVDGQGSFFSHHEAPIPGSTLASAPGPEPCTACWRLGCGGRWGAGLAAPGGWECSAWGFRECLCQPGMCLPQASFPHAPMPLTGLQPWESRLALLEDPVSSFWEWAVLCSFLSQELVPSRLRLSGWQGSRHFVLNVSQQQQEDRPHWGWKKPSNWPLSASPRL